MHKETRFALSNVEKKNKKKKHDKTVLQEVTLEDSNIFVYGLV